MTKEQLDNWIDSVDKNAKAKCAWVSVDVYHKIKKYFDKNNKYRGLFFTVEPTMQEDTAYIQ